MYLQESWLITAVMAYHGIFVITLHLFAAYWSIKQGTLLPGIKWPPSPRLGTRGPAHAALAPERHGKLLYGVAISVSLIRFLTEQEEWMSGLWLCLFSLVISLVSASSLAMVNKYPLRDLCSPVKGSFQVLLNEEYTVWEAYP